MHSKKGDTIMNTIAIDSNIYKGAESYAKLHNISVTAAIEKAISLFLQKVQPKQKLLETAEFNDALSYVKTLKAKGGKPIPADENSLDALLIKNMHYESFYRYEYLNRFRCKSCLNISHVVIP